jgi:hypothetical protein
MRLTSCPSLATTLVAFSIFPVHALAAFNASSQLAGNGILAMPSINIQTVHATSSLGPLPSAALLALAKKPVVQAFDSSLKPCPASCIDTGTSPDNWTVYHDTSRLAWCNQSMLLDFAIYNALDDPNAPTTIRACTSDASANSARSLAQLSRRFDVSSCIPAKNDMETTVSLNLV